MAQSEPASGESVGGQVRLERIYLKDASWESPRTPDSGAETVQPEMQVDINTRVNRVDDRRHEVVLSITVRAVGRFSIKVSNNNGVSGQATGLGIESEQFFNSRQNRESVFDTFPLCLAASLVFETDDVCAWNRQFEFEAVVINGDKFKSCFSYFLTQSNSVTTHPGLNVNVY